MQDVPQSKVIRVGHLVVRHVRARLGMQQTRALQDALVFADKEAFNSVPVERVAKVRVKSHPGCHSGGRGVTAAVVKVVRLVARQQLAVPKRIRGRIRHMVCHPNDRVLVVDREQFFGKANEPLVIVTCPSKAANIGPHLKLDPPFILLLLMVLVQQ